MKRNRFYCKNTLWNVIDGDESDQTERNWMDQNVKILIWNGMGDNGSNKDGLELNGLYCGNVQWNVMGDNVSDWNRNKPKVTEWIKTWRFCYGVLRETTNTIGKAWNGMDINLKMRYKMWWKAINNIGKEIKLR